MSLVRPLACLWLAVATTAARAQATPPVQAPSSPPAAPRATAPSRPPASRVLTLEEAVHNARVHQPQLRQARAATAAAVARVDEAFSALMPQVTATGTYQRTTSNFVPRPSITLNNITAPAESWSTIGYWTFQGTASELVYDFGQTSQHWRSAQAAAGAQRGTEQATLLQSLLNVRAAYFTARAGKDLVQVARETLTNQDAHLRQIEGFVRAGTRPEIDLAQARTDRANAEVQLITAENQYATARAQLNQTMGVEDTTDYDVGDETLPTVEGEEATTDALVEIAIQSRPDLASLRQQVRANELTLSSVRGAYAPSLGVSTSFTEAGSSTLVWNWNAAATLTWNLFQGGLTRAQEREARANIEAAQAQFDTERQQIRVEVEQARLAVRAAKATLGAAGEALVNAQQRLRLAEGRYQAGVGSVIELGDAQVALTTAAAQRVQAQYNLSTSRAQLLRALGSDGEIGTR